MRKLLTTLALLAAGCGRGDNLCASAAAQILACTGHSVASDGACDPEGAAQILAGGCDALGAGGGKADTGRADPGHPNALALWDTEFECSGTLVGPHTLLTAGHCLEDPIVLGDRKLMMVDTGDGIVHAPGADYGQPADRPGFVYASSWVFHPNYKKGSTSDDVAVLELDQPVDGIAPAVLDARSLAALEPITIVGFGYRLLTKDDPGDYGTKRVTTNVISDLWKTNFSFYNRGDIAGTTCHGDSGGPSYHEGDVETLVGQHESIDGDTCGYEAIDMRIDYYLPFYACNSGADTLLQYLDGKVQPLPCAGR